MNIRWVKIRSWHALSGIVSRGGQTQTLCGRWVIGDIVDELPTEKSCESCLRILARREDS